MAAIISTSLLIEKYAEMTIQQFIVLVNLFSKEQILAINNL
jgi:hypothetical protein